MPDQARRILFAAIIFMNDVLFFSTSSAASAKGGDRGSCSNCGTPMCHCNTTGGWKLSPLGVCNCNDKFCRQDIDSSLCSGNGNCDCDSCLCDATTNNNQILYTGQYCERCVHPECATPSGTCTNPVIQECAICVHEQDRLFENVATKCDSVCQKRDVFYRVLNQLPNCESCPNVNQTTSCSLCESFSTDPSFFSPLSCSMETSVDDCRLWYQIVWEKNQNRFEVNVRRFVREQDCFNINILPIVLGVTLGIVFIGILILILWKILQTLSDRQEYLKFLNESVKKKRWQIENPLFKKPIVRTVNPLYGGPPGEDNARPRQR